VLEVRLEELIARARVTGQDGEALRARGVDEARLAALLDGDEALAHREKLLANAKTNAAEAGDDDVILDGCGEGHVPRLHSVLAVEEEDAEAHETLREDDGGEKGDEDEEQPQAPVVRELHGCLEGEKLDDVEDRFDEVGLRAGVVEERERRGTAEDDDRGEGERDAELVEEHARVAHDRVDAAGDSARRIHASRSRARQLFVQITITWAS
jgi:hypothetical protein